MAWLGFRTRSSERDRETDRIRMEHVLNVLATQVSAIEAEKKGLRDRYRRAADDAAFSLDAMENGDTALSPKVDALTATMSRYTERIRSLDAQAVLLRTLRESVVSFMVAQGVDPAQPDT